MHLYILKAKPGLCVPPGRKKKVSYCLLCVMTGQKDIWLLSFVHVILQTNKQTTQHQVLYMFRMLRFQCKKIQLANFLAVISSVRRLISLRRSWWRKKEKNRVYSDGRTRYSQLVLLWSTPSKTMLVSQDLSSFSNCFFHLPAANRQLLHQLPRGNSQHVLCQ